MENDIIHPLEKLERENRRMKKIGIVAAVFAVVLFISGQAKTNKGPSGTQKLSLEGKTVVEANEFRLVDDSGKVRADLTMMSASGPELSFYDDHGTVVAYISTTPDPGLYLGEPGTKERAVIRAGTSDKKVPTQPISVGCSADRC